jgi:hypothetical protein
VGLKQQKKKKKEQNKNKRGSIIAVTGKTKKQRNKTAASIPEVFEKAISMKAVDVRLKRKQEKERRNSRSEAEPCTDLVKLATAH